MPDDIEAAVADSASATEKMGALRTLIETARDTVATTEEAWKNAKAALLSIEMNVAVEAMRSLELESYEFADGATIRREQRIHATIPEAKEKEAFVWLKANGHGSMLKLVCSLEFGKNEAHLAEVLQAFCARMVPQYEIEVTYGSVPQKIIDALEAFIKESFPKHELKIETHVHASTLRAFVKKQLGAGKILPECFAVFAPQVAAFDIPKKEQASF